MVRHLALTLSGAAQQLSSALPVVTDAVTADKDIPIRQLTLQPKGTNASVIYVGLGAAPTAANYAWRLEAGTAGVPPAPFLLGEMGLGRFRLSDVYVLGTLNEVLLIGVFG